MAISLTKPAAMRPPRILLYGTGGIGKTTFGAGMPAPVFIPLEEGVEGHDVLCTPRPRTWDELAAIIDELRASTEPFRSVVIDSMSVVQDIAYQHICTLENEKSIEGLPYGKGYTMAGDLVRGFLSSLDALRSTGRAVLLIAHKQTTRIADPRLTTEYDKHSPRLQSNSKGAGIGPMVIEWVDAVLFADYEQYTTKQEGRTYAIGEGKRVLFTCERPAYVAKNRYNLPESIDMSWTGFVNAARKETQ